MSAVNQISAPVTMVAGTTATAADVNSNFTDFRSAFNNLVTGANAIAIDVIAENTSAAGVTIDGVLLKDSGITATIGAATPNTGAFTSITATLTLAVTGASTLTGDVGIGAASASNQKLLASVNANQIALRVENLDSGSSSARLVTLSVAATTRVFIDMFAGGVSKFSVSGTGDVILAGGITSGANIVSDADSTDDLGATGTRWANLWVDAITLGGTLAGAVATFSSTLGVTGNVGIGEAAGSIALRITEADSVFGIVLTNTHASAPNGVAVDYSVDSPNDTTHWFFRGEDSTTIRVALRSNGGIANFQSNDVDLCDERRKDILDPLGSSWAVLRALQIKTFRYKDDPDSRLMIGVTAQNVQSACPDAVCEWGAPDGAPTLGTLKKEPMLAVNNKDLLMHAIRTIQELQDRLEALEA